MKSILFGYRLDKPVSGAKIQTAFTTLVKDSGFLQLVQSGNALACFLSDRAYHQLLMAGTDQEHAIAVRGQTPVSLDHKCAKLDPNKLYDHVWLLPVDLDTFARRQGWYVYDTSLAAVREAAEELGSLLQIALQSLDKK